MKRLTQIIVKKTIPDWEKVQDQTVRTRYGVLGGWASIVVNVLLAAGKGLLGLVSGSLSLLADALHTLSDVATSLVILISFRIAGKPSDEEHPFGHGRMEAVATLIVAMLLILIGFEILKSGVHRLIHPRAFQASWAMVAAIGLTILIKELLARFSLHLGEMIDSDSLRADFWHHRTDAISSILVVIAFLGQKWGIVWADGAMSILVAFMILYAGWSVGRNGVNELLGKTPDPDLVQSVKKEVVSLPGILDVHDVIIHQYGQTRIVSLHIEVCESTSLKEAHAKAEEVEVLLATQFYSHSTVHLDPVNMNDPELNAIRECLKNLQARFPGFSFHDLRTVGDAQSKNVLLDINFDPALKEKEIIRIRKEIKALLTGTFPNIKGVVYEVEPRYAM